MPILIIFAISAVLSVCAVFLVLKISHRKKWYDKIDERKIHSGNIPRLGGIGFALAFFIIIAGIGVVFGISSVNIKRFIPCAAAMAITLVSGAYDDFRSMSPLYKLILQFIAALCVIIAGFDFETLLYQGGGLLTDPGFLTYPVTLLWIIGLTNAFNFIDGVDGLAGGVSAIIVLFLGIIYFSFGGMSDAVIICTCLFGVLAGFLVFNAPFPRAKIFMGDCGSQFLGFTLALLPLLKEADRTASLPLFYAAALFSIPILDTTSAVWRRIRDGKKISDPDKSHLHHKLMNLGLTPKAVIALIFSVQIILGVLTFISIRIVDKGIPSLIAISGAYVFALIFFILIHYLNRAVKAKKAAANKEENPS
jgi:UDP-GlcNAc:undecaprenyl-phosphate GlcNAc-1-phosphate transferase